MITRKEYMMPDTIKTLPANLMAQMRTGPNGNRMRAPVLIGVGVLVVFVGLWLNPFSEGGDQARVAHATASVQIEQEKAKTKIAIAQEQARAVIARSQEETKQVQARMELEKLKVTSAAEQYSALLQKGADPIVASCAIYGSHCEKISDRY